MSDLLPCPFCGSANIDPACDDCDALADTVEIWNTRSSPAAKAGGGETEAADLARSIAYRIKEGDGCWRTCSGCHESVDGYDVGHYPYSKTFQCKLGSGCSECGGVGAVWDNIDYEDMAKAALSPHPEARAGWQLVPVEPTKEMVTAAWDVWQAHEDKRVAITGGSGQISNAGWETNYYKAMLAAAPPAPALPGGEWKPLGPSPKDINADAAKADEPHITMPRWWLDDAYRKMMTMGVLPSGPQGDFLFQLRDHFGNMLASQPPSGREVKAN